MKRLFFISLISLMAVVMSPGGGDRADLKAAPAAKENLQICITFDDLPVVRVSDRIQRLMITDEILFTLEEYGVPAAGFVIGDNIEGDLDILESWLESGHTLGNHTFSHPDLNEVPPDLFIDDIKKGGEAIEGVLEAARQKKRYFRYPSLHTGNTYEAQKAVADFLDAEGYKVAPVSIDTDDFAYNLQFEKMEQSGDSMKIIQLGNEYLDHIMERLEAAEKLSQELLGRQVKHILLLHANRLNSTFLADLLAAFSSLGYKFISLDKALTDPVYAMTDGYVGSKGLSVLERLAASDPDMLPASED